MVYVIANYGYIMSYEQNNVNPHDNLTHFFEIN